MLDLFVFHCLLARDFHLLHLLLVEVHGCPRLWRDASSLRLRQERIHLWDRPRERGDGKGERGEWGKGYRGSLNAMQGGRHIHEQKTYGIECLNVAYKYANKEACSLRCRVQGLGLGTGWNEQLTSKTEACSLGSLAVTRRKCTAFGFRVRFA